ncbi:hypothetical protein STEG23_003989 [Scotinomys teguina]
MIPRDINNMYHNVYAVSGVQSHTVDGTIYPSIESFRKSLEHRYCLEKKKEEEEEGEGEEERGEGEGREEETTMDSFIFYNFCNIFIFSNIQRSRDQKRTTSKETQWRPHQGTGKEATADVTDVNSKSTAKEEEEEEQEENKEAESVEEAPKKKKKEMTEQLLWKPQTVEVQSQPHLSISVWKTRILANLPLKEKPICECSAADGR